MVAGTQQALHHQSRPHSVVQSEVFGDATLLHHQRDDNWLQKHNSLIVDRLLQFQAHQGVDVVAIQSSLVNNLSLQHNEEEEESQHHVTKVTEDVVEGAVQNDRRYRDVQDEQPWKYRSESG